MDETSAKAKTTQSTFAEVLKAGTQPSYGARIKSLLPPIAYSQEKPKLQIERKGPKVTASFLQEAEPKLLDPFRWVLRGAFKRRRPSIKTIDEVITSNLPLAKSIQVAPYRSSEVMIRCLSEKDYTTILTKNAIRVGETQMRIFRWSPEIDPPWSYAALWFNIDSLPPHLASPACLRELLNPWGTLLAVHSDVLYLTRPEVTQVCLEVDLNQEWPLHLNIISSYGSFECSVTVVKKPRWCKHCGLMGHTDEVCRYLSRRQKITNSRSGKQRDAQETMWIPAKKKGNPMDCQKCRRIGYKICRCPLTNQQEKAASTKMEKNASGKIADMKNSAKEIKFPNLVENNGKSGKEMCQIQLQHSKEEGRLRETGECSKTKKSPTRKDVKCEGSELQDSIKNGNSYELTTESNGAKKEDEPRVTATSENVEIYDSCASEQEDWEEEPSKTIAESNVQAGNDAVIQIEPLSPAVSEIQRSAKKSKYGPLQWSSIAGDLHLNYKVWGALEDEEILLDRKIDPPKNNSVTGLICSHIPKDPKFSCRECSIAKVPQKGNICKICNFQISKRSRRKKSRASPPRYEAKSENGLSTKEREDEWERRSKRDFQIRAEKCLQTSKKAAGKVEDIPPPKMKWADMSSDEEEQVEVVERQKDPDGNPKGWGKKIKSRISTTEGNEHRRTRSGRGSKHSSEGEREQWIEGIRLLKVNRYDQRHNATWQQWEVAPEMKIDRRERKRIEDLAQRNENAK